MSTSTVKHNTEAMQQTPAHVIAMVQRLVETFNPERVYLFGSQARGDQHSDSDYDFMVLVENTDLPGYKLSQIGYEALQEFHVAKDVLVWQRMQFDKRLHLVASLPATIIREGKLLYER